MKGFYSNSNHSVCAANTLSLHPYIQCGRIWRKEPRTRKSTSTSGRSVFPKMIVCQKLCQKQQPSSKNTSILAKFNIFLCPISSLIGISHFNTTMHFIIYSCSTMVSLLIALPKCSVVVSQPLCRPRTT